MKNNLLKSVAAAATASALLFSTVTSFAAATANTVTTYNNDGTINIASTIDGVASGTMVTYLASKNGSVATAEDIVYIGQQTADGTTPIRFVYNTKSGVTQAEVKYGASDTATANDLNTSDTHKSAKVGNVTATAIGGCHITESDIKVGNGGTATVHVTLDPGYEIVEAYVNGVPYATLGNAYEIPYAEKMTFDVIAGAVSKDYTNVVKVKDDTNTDTAKEIVCHKFVANQDTNNVTFGVYAKRADNAPYNIDNKNYVNGFYAASFVTDTETNYYAVRLEADDLSGVTLYPAYLKDNTVNYFDGSIMTIDN